MMEDTSFTDHPDAQWFTTAGLGLFLHWGISSVHGGLDISWSMIKNTTWDMDYHEKNKVTPREYYRLADRFNPQHYDPDLWLKAAAAAGFRYAVLTTRHHDGYAMWPSKYGNLGTRTHMNGRDLLVAYVEACRKNGMKVGFYYSPPDWNFYRDYMSFDIRTMNSEAPNRIGSNLDHELVQIKTPPPNLETEFRDYERGQITELLTNYGKIDLIWFDGIPSSISINEMRQMQPGMVIGRWPAADFESWECMLPKEKPARVWEGCLIWNYHSWAYQKPDGYNPTGWMLHLLAHHRAWGGNLLMNCAPTPDGTMPESYYERMAELKEWMEWGAESIFEIEAGPYPEQCSVPVTVRGNKWYLHLLCPEDDDKGTSWFLHLVDPKYPVRQYQRQEKRAVLANVHASPRSIRLLRTGETIDPHLDGDQMTIALSQEKSSLLDDVVVVDW